MKPKKPANMEQKWWTLMEIWWITGISYWSLYHRLTPHLEKRIISPKGGSIRYERDEWQRKFRQIYGDTPV